MMILLGFFMRLQKTYWPFFFREDNTFMDSAYFVIFLAPTVGAWNMYFGLVMLYPFVNRLSMSQVKKE